MRYKSKYTSYIEKTLVKLTVTGNLFTHISIDPLGGIRFNFVGSTFTKLIFPLIITDINLGAVEVCLMMNNKTKNIFLSLMRLQDRYSTQVTQVFSDKGSNLLSKNLGQECNFFATQLAKLWQVKNNTAGAQHRNYTERYVQLLKKQCLYAAPCRQEKTIEFETVQNIMASACRIVNDIPYLNNKNHQNICPNDFLNPAALGKSEVPNLPQGSLPQLGRIRKEILGIHDHNKKS